MVVDVASELELILIFGYCLAREKRLVTGLDANTFRSISMHCLLFDSE